MGARLPLPEGTAPARAYVVYDMVYEADEHLPRRGAGRCLWDRVAEAEGVSRAELIRALIDRAIGGHPGADLAADLAAIEASFGILAGQDAFSRTRDQRMDYLDRLADG